MLHATTESEFINRYMREIGRVRLLTIDEETALAQQVLKGDQSARDRMILANLRLVVKIAYDYAHMGVPLIDLISEGNLGLIKAVERFKPGRGGRLATYASWWIRQAVKKALADQGKMIRLPMHMVEKIVKMRRTNADLTAKLKREPTLAEISKATRFSQKRIGQLRNLVASAISLQSSSNGTEEGATLEETLGDEQSRTPWVNLLAKADAEQVKEILGNMDARESEILRLRYGLDSQNPKTLDEIGQALGLTRERVRQLEMEAQARFKRLLTSDERPRTRAEAADETRLRAKVEILRQFMVEKGLLK